MINVTKIMAELEQEVHKKMNNPEYVKDVNRLRKLSVDKQISSTTSDLYSQTFLARRMIVPHSTRKGIVSKILNIVIVKFYYVVAKILDPVLNTQERFNRAILEEVVALKEKAGSKGENDFPYVKYSEKILGNTDVDFSVYKDIVANKKRVLDLSAWNRKFLDFAKSNGAQELFGVDIGATEVIDEDFQIQNTDLVDFLTSRGDNEFDVIVLFNRLGYFNLNYINTVFSQIRRTLKEGGVVVIEEFSPKDFIQTDDFRVINPVSEKMTQFLLEHYEFFNIKNIDINNKSKYAISAQKS